MGLSSMLRLVPVFRRSFGITLGACAMAIDTPTIIAPVREARTMTHTINRRPASGRRYRYDGMYDGLACGAGAGSGAAAGAQDRGPPAALGLSGAGGAELPPRRTDRR